MALLLPDVNGGRRLTSVLLTAVVALAAVVSTAVYLGRSGSPARRSASSPPPGPSPAAPASPSPLPPRPPSLPLLLYQREGAPGYYYAADWTGRPFQAIDWRNAPWPEGIPSPDGSRLAGPPYTLPIGIYVPGQSAIARLDTGPWAQTVGGWADDSRHLCTIGFDGRHPAGLYVLAEGEQARLAGSYGSAADAAGITILACSEQADRAVLALAGGCANSAYCVGNTAHVWVVRLSTGEILYQRDYPGGNTVVSASRDAALLVEAPATAGHGTTVLRQAANGNPIGVTPNTIVALSWDGSMAAGYTSDGLPVVFEMDTGTQVWFGPPGQQLAAYWPMDGGSSIAFLLIGPPEATATGSLVIVWADGTELLLASDVPIVTPPWPL